MIIRCLERINKFNKGKNYISVYFIVVNFFISICIIFSLFEWINLNEIFDYLLFDVRLFVSLFRGFFYIFDFFLDFFDFLELFV